MSTIGIALIAKNEAANTRRLIPWLNRAEDKAGRKIFDQIVVVVDNDSTDGTAELAAALGAEVYRFDWVDDFSAKREYAFSQLTTDWCGWLDFDDEIKGVDVLREVLDTLDEHQASALWCLYQYDQIGDHPNAQHRRERFVHRGQGWHWTRPVHEHMVTDKSVLMIANDDVQVIHQRDRSLDPQRAARNLRILHRHRKLHPADARTYFDLGSQYYHGRRYARCLAMYRHFLKLHAHPAECYQALHRIADCYRFLNKLDQARHYDHQAAILEPEFADAWFGLADCAFVAGKFQMALDYIDLGFKRARPPDVLVLNDYDYNLLPLLTKQRCQAALGDIDAAAQTLATCEAIYPDLEEIAYAKALYHKILSEKANVAQVLALDVPNPTLLFQSLDPAIQRKKEVRDKLLAPIYTMKNIPDLTIFCGPSVEDWGPHTPATTGIGGSETAVIAIATELAALGLDVDVYNQCGREEGRYGNVRFLDYTRYEDLPTRLFVSWRAARAGSLATKAEERWLWCHDLHYAGEITPESTACYDLVRPVSQWHANRLKWLYPFLADKLKATRNGISLERFGPPGERKNQVIYCSSPDRGLPTLLRLWPMIYEQCPDSELNVFYGWHTFDAIAKTRPDMQLFKQYVLKLADQPGVKLRGRLNQRLLAREMQESLVLAYPTGFQEVSCITAMESMAAGCVVLSSKTGALPETCQDAALLVNGHPDSESYREIFAKDLIALLRRPEARATYQERGYARAGQLTWSDVANEWLTTLNVKEISA